MKPPPFDYVAAGTVDQAVALLEGDADARVIAGGQSLMPLLNLRLASPELIVDIGRIEELHSISVDDDGLTIGAGVTQAAVSADPDVTAGWSLLADAIGLIGHAQIRNRGTLCGSLAHNDPLAELPAVALALDASVSAVSGNGRRTIPAGDLGIGPFMTSLDSGEFITAATFAPLPPATGCSIREFATRTGDFATAGVVTRLTLVRGAATNPRVVLFGLGPQAHRSSIVEAAIEGATGPVLDDDVLARFTAELSPNDDAHASASARRQLAAELIAASVAEAWERAL